MRSARSLGQSGGYHRERLFRAPKRKRRAESPRLPEGARLLAIQAAYKLYAANVPELVDGVLNARRNTKAAG